IAGPDSPRKHIGIIVELIPEIGLLVIYRKEVFNPEVLVAETNAGREIIGNAVTYHRRYAKSYGTGTHAETQATSKHQTVHIKTFGFAIFFIIRFSCFAATIIYFLRAYLLNGETCQH